MSDDEPQDTCVRCGEVPDGEEDDLLKISGKRYESSGAGWPDILILGGGLAVLTAATMIAIWVMG